MTGAGSVVVVVVVVVVVFEVDLIPALGSTPFHRL